MLALVLGSVALRTGQPGTGSRTALAPSLAHALEQARADAAQAGVEILITSGRRSAEEQQRLFDEAVERYGSAEEAAQWVLPPEESAHVSGEAIDVAAEGADWLVAEGWRHGLCRRYANEWWHFELLTEPGAVCPELVPHAGAD